MTTTHTNPRYILIDADGFFGARATVLGTYRTAAAAKRALARWNAAGTHRAQVKHCSSDWRRGQTISAATVAQMSGL